MQKISKTYRRLGSETGSVLLIVAASMVLLLAISAFAIDMANFYLARAQAQRAADAAALAGAKAFVTTACITSGCVPGGPQDALARQMAESTGAQNYVAGQPTNIQDGDVTFNEINPYEPQVTVTVKRAVPTFFAKIFGIDAANISTASTAEAYQPGENGASPLAVHCLKPFLVPNCDPEHSSPENTDHCAGMGYFFDPNNNNDVAHDGPYSKGGIIGEHWQLHTESGPSQWYLVGYGSPPPSSGSALREHIIGCTPAPETCTATLVTANGVNVGPISQGIEQLIGANNYGMDQGQDSITTDTTTTEPPFPMEHADSMDPFYDYSESRSVATVPVYGGGTLPAGGSEVGIVGYLQVFIQDVVHNGNDNHIDVIILNATKCKGSDSGSGLSSGSSPVVGSAGSPVPIRLIRTD